MKYIFTCRRTFVALVAISALTFLGYYSKMDVASAIATVSLSVAAANATQKALQKSDIPPGPLE